MVFADVCTYVFYYLYDQHMVMWINIAESDWSGLGNSSKLKGVRISRLDIRKITWAAEPSHQFDSSVDDRGA